MKYYSVFLLACLLAFSSCGKESIKISPETITVDYSEQIVIFKTDNDIQTVHFPGYAESAEPMRIFEYGCFTWLGKWFRLELSRDNEIHLMIDENTGKDRQLEFTVHHYKGSATAVVTQLGAASQQ